MSNWYKKSQQIGTFQERNILNAKIQHLEKIVKILEYSADLIYQTQRGARGVVQKVIADKRLSSFPDIKHILSEADKAAMDSPKRFSISVLKGAAEIKKRIIKLKSERKKATEKGLPPKGFS